MNVRIATWNINSIRARLELLKEVINNNKLDIILLQETKCQNTDFPLSYIQSINWNCVYSGQKSYNGVAILSKYQIELEANKLPLYSYTDNYNEERYIEAILTINNKILRLASIYVPQGASILQVGETLEQSERFKYKIDFYNRLKERINEIKIDTNNFNDEFVIFAGDFNVAQDEIDLHNPKANNGNVCFHPLERNALKEIRNVGLDDVFRVKYPETRQYTWWDYKTKGFERNVGWRLDYLLCSQNIIKNTKNIYIDMETRAQKKTSDHSPSILEFDI